MLVLKKCIKKTYIYLSRKFLFTVINTAYPFLKWFKSKKLSLILRNNKIV